MRSSKEVMNADGFFGKYTMSSRSLERIKTIRDTMKENISESDSAWTIIIGKKEEGLSSDDEDSDNKESSDEVPEVYAQPIQFKPSQNFLSQANSYQRQESVRSAFQISDIVESVHEGLERTNGNIDLSSFQNLSDQELLDVLTDLKRKLSITGVYNLCCSIINMDVEQCMQFMNALCTNLLLPMVIDISEPSRLLSSAFAELVEKFADDVEKLIFIPILNAELKDSTIINIIVKTYDSNRRANLLSEFLTNVKELKEWHVSILETLLTVKTDHNINAKLVTLFSEKAYVFRKDKNFAKLVLFFLKKGATFSEEEKGRLNEIATVNETVFKNAMKSVLTNL